MEYNKILISLTSIEKGNNNEATIEATINKTLLLLSEKDKEIIVKRWENLSSDNDVMWKYVLFAIYIIEEMKRSINDNNEGKFSIKQIQLLKILFNGISLLGLKPNCIIFNEPNEKVDSQVQRRKYEKLIYTTNFCVECFDDFLFKTCIFGHLRLILTALIFIAFNVNTCSSSSDEVNKSGITENTQMEFKKKLCEIMEKCPLPMLMKELIVIFGQSENFGFVRSQAKQYLINYIMDPNGVTSLISAICNEDILNNIENHWEKLQFAAKLLALSCGTDSNTYYNSICNQYINLLKEKNAQSTVIAICCINVLYEHHTEVCCDKILKVIAAPFFEAKDKIINKGIIWTESEVTESITLLSKCFATDVPEFKQLPVQMLIPIIQPIFDLYIKSFKSISCLQQNIKQLTLKIFSMEAIRKELFYLFLEYDGKFTHNYGAKIQYEYGDSGNFVITDKCKSNGVEDVSDALLELVGLDETLSFTLFSAVLESLECSEEFSLSNINDESDIVLHITRKMSVINLLEKLANLPSIRNNFLEKPEAFLNFIKNLIEKRIACGNEISEKEEEIMDITYIGLTFMNLISNETKKCKNWTAFEEFVAFLNSEKVLRSLSSKTKLLVEEITQSVRTRREFNRKNYDDLSTSKKKSDFDKALEDLSDPLLPVRAHGLMFLTKLIEQNDRKTLELKDIVILLLQENLKDEDSFIYLAAINGVCSLALKFPESVIEILIKEFISMPEKGVEHKLSVENRVKIGEVLVKTTRNLGEMASKYKVSLINAFLCNIRDSDSLIRSSSLSCLGELCKILGFRLGNILIEVIYCIDCIIKNDKDTQCRRAAVMVIALLLRGLGKDILVSISENLLPIYKNLKYLRDNSKDDVIRLHAEIALEEINDIVKSQLFVQPKLEKKIFLVS